MHTVSQKLDFHIESFIENIVPEHPDEVLVIAGDIGHSNLQNQLLLAKLGKIYKKVFIVFGNHDLYLVTKSMYHKYGTGMNRLAEMKKMTLDIENVYDLDGDLYEYNGVKYSGTDMWYDGVLSNNNLMYDINKKIISHPDPTEEDLQNLWLDYMNDCNHIYGMERYDQFFETEVKKLEKNIDKADVYISHVGPALPKRIPAKFDMTYLRYFYFDGMKYLQAEAAPKVWVFGHVHGQYDYSVNNTDLLVNPLGYPKESFGRKIRNYEKHCWED
jgi:predicted phosphodiesterase